MSGVTSWQDAPIHGRATEVEPAIACATTVRTMLEGMAKPMPIEPPRAREDRRVDADQRAVHVDQRAAGIAGIDGGIGLDEEAGIVDAEIGARDRRDDAARHRLADAEGIADGKHEVADLELVGIAEVQAPGNASSPFSIFRTARSVRSSLSRILAWIFAPVGERHLHLGRVADDVVVGDDDARSHRR